MPLKKYFRLFLFNLASIWFVSTVVPGVLVEGGFQSLIYAAGALTLVNFIVKPILKLLLLPINLITLGAFRWLVNVLTVYIVTILVPDFSIVAFDFIGYSYQGFIIPSIHLNPVWALIVSSFMLSLSTTFLLWLVK